MRKATATASRRAATKPSRGWEANISNRRATRRGVQSDLTGGVSEDGIDQTRCVHHGLAVDPIIPSEILGEPEGGESTNVAVYNEETLSTAATHHDDSNAVVDEVNQKNRNPRREVVGLVTPSAKPKARKSRAKKADADGDVVQTMTGSQSALDNISTLIDTITMTWRQRMVLVKQGTAGINRAVGFCRTLMDGDKDKGQDLYDKAIKGEPHPKAVQALPVIFAMSKAKDLLDADKAEIEKRLVKLAKDLPASKFILETKGVSMLYFAGIIAEAGDLTNYPQIDPDRQTAERGPAALRKRFGLAPMAGKSGSNWKKAAGKPGALTAKEWTEFGYVGRRRNVVWQVGNGLIGGMGRGPRPMAGEDFQSRTDWTDYQKLFVSEMIRLAERDPEAHARPTTTEGKMSFSKHAADMAKRVVEQKFLRDLWVEWRRERGQRPDDPHGAITPLPQQLAA